MSVFDSHDFVFECPKDGCSGKVNATLGKLRRSPTVRCPKCQSEIKIDARELDDGMRSVQRRLDDLARKLNRVFRIG